MRRALVATLALGAAVAVSATAAPAAPAPGYREDVRVASVDVFARILPVVRRTTDVPVLLPARLDVDAARGRLVATGGGRRGGWDMELASAPDCGGATACFVAALTAERGARLDGPPNVRLTGGVPARFRGLSCGGSCSPPSIQWRLGGVRYAMQVKAATPTRANLMRMASSAILAGPR